MRWKRRPAIILVPLLIPACLLCGPAGKATAADDVDEKEAAIYVVTRWDQDCDADRRSEWDDMVEAWFNEIGNDGALPGGHGADAWTMAGWNINGHAFDSDFVDPDNEAWGDDINHADVVDALMIGLHGGNDDGNHRWHGVLRYDEAGAGNCYIYQGHMELGDGDLEFLHLSSCFSMDREDWWNEWNSTFDGLHQIDGFHGIMWISEDYAGRYRHFADDSFWIGMADSWLDHLYITHWYVSNRDQCPVARVVGSDAQNSLFRMNSERYNFVLDDPEGLGQSRHHRARYIRGCNPRGKEALPQ